MGKVPALREERARFLPGRHLVFPDPGKRQPLQTQHIRSPLSRFVETGSDSAAKGWTGSLLGPMRRFNRGNSSHELLGIVSEFVNGRTIPRWPESTCQGSEVLIGLVPD
jgi:hypothetical protein